MTRIRKKSGVDRQMPSTGLGSQLIDREEKALVLDVLHRREPFRYYGGDSEAPPPMAATLEKEFSGYIGTKFGLAVSSGTAALEVAFGALGIGPGDEVILPVWSWISCWTSIVRVGALPVPAEIDDTLCLAPSEIRRLRTSRTKAVMVVHYQGVAADMEPILAEAKRAAIAVVEDCAESPGALYHGKRLGALGTVGTFSFQYHKSITSGEGGMVTTDDPALYERAVRMHDLGQFRPFHQQIINPTQAAFCGSQFRMSELQAAVALAQLRKLERIRTHCRRMRGRLLAKIGDLPGLEFRRIPDPSGDTGFETYIFLKSARQAAAFCNRLQELNVPCYPRTGTDCHYNRDYCAKRLAHSPAASPLRKFRAWPARGYRKEDFPQTESLVHRFVALPVGARFTAADADYVGEMVRRVHDEIC
jgi:8-amino-3,8-dideoxy-alpha-D-manno-octulosonate transaminase